MIKLNILKYLLFFISFASCDFSIPGTTGDPEPVFQTTILAINFEPDTLIVGDTLTIHCLISDSLDDNFKFDWNLDSDRIIPVNGSIDRSRIKWVSKESDFDGFIEDVLLVSGSVIVYNPEDSINSPAYKAFNIKIKNRE